jgi:hypothetical protein
MTTKKLREIIARTVDRKVNAKEMDYLVEDAKIYLRNGFPIDGIEILDFPDGTLRIQQKINFTKGCQ